MTGSSSPILPLRPRRALIVAIVTAGMALLAAGSAAEEAASPILLAAAGEKCVQISNRDGREELVNTCAICREVKVKRTRGSNDFPSIKNYTVTQRGKVDLSYKGPGRTEIMADDPCPGADAAQADASRCVHLFEPMGKSAVLYNDCTGCRAVKVEMKGTGNPARQTYTIKGKTYVPTPWLKAATARVISDSPCG